MTLDEMLLEIEQTSKYGTPLLTHHAVAILAKLRAAEELAFQYEGMLECLEGNEDEDVIEELKKILKTYRAAGKS